MISPVTRTYAKLLLASIGLLAALACATATATIYNVRFDLSPGNRFTLSDHALGVLRGLDRPVKVTAFIRTGDGRNPILKDLLWQAARETPYLSYDVVDVNKNPARAGRLGVSTYGSCVVESGARRADFSIPTERYLISAIVHVTAPSAKVYFLTGHGECNLDSPDSKSGCSRMRAALSLEFYEVENLALVSAAAIPDDADVVAIVGPQQDLLPRELDAIASYLDRGGDLLVLLDPYQASKLTTLLGRYGIKVGSDVVLDPDNRLAGGEQFSSVVPRLNRQHPITGALESPVLLSGMRSVSVSRELPEGSRGTWLLKTGERSWASADPTVLEGAKGRFVAGRDLNGPLAVAAAVTSPVPADPAAVMRLVVIGDADFATNRFLDYLSNRDLLVNAANWLVRQERFISARAPGKTPGVNWLFVSHEDLATIFWASAIVEPGLFLLLGLILFLRRRLTA